MTPILEGACYWSTNLAFQAMENLSYAIHLQVQCDAIQIVCVVPLLAGDPEYILDEIKQGP